MTMLPAASPYFERIDFPADPSLPALPKLFDADWVRQMVRGCAAAVRRDPHRIRIHHFIHSIGSSATVSYEVEWPKDQYLPSEYYVAALRRDGQLQIHRYPDDQRLPGLAGAAQPETALRLVNDHVLTVPARRARVQLIRYRPAYRAVLRHRIGKVKLYARIVRPSAFEPVLAAYRLSAQSGFAVPRLGGYWAAGGVFWFTEVRGRNLRPLVREGKAPNPDRLLHGLEVLWRLPPENYAVRPFDLARAYRRASRSFKHNLRDDREASRSLNAATESLAPFVRSWRPSCMAHNDFYDDQMLVLRDERIALVDFEEIAAGDPMLDVGNFLAHLRWSSRFTREARAANCRDYHSMLRDAAIARFRWNKRSLALREAVCLFRVCTNAIRHPRANWQSKLKAGLSLVNECLG